MNANEDVLMVLEYGIDSFNEGFCSLYCDDECITAFFDAKDAIIAVFMEHPEILDRPYSSYVEGSIFQKDVHILMRNSSYKIPEEPARQNPIYQAVIKQNLLRFGQKLSQRSLWPEISLELNKLNKSENENYAQSYSLVDMACYLLFILNIYVPNRALIYNIVSTHTKIDALGRENFTAADAALQNVVRKSVSGSIFPDQQAKHLRVLAKHEIKKMNIFQKSNRGIDFEKECQSILIFNDFDVQETPASGDYGADIIAVKDDLGYAIQCKDTSKPVGVKAVQEAVAARSHYKVDFAVVCASAGFTDAAIELATSNKVILCNADQLVRRLDSV